MLIIFYFTDHVPGQDQGQGHVTEGVEGGLGVDQEVDVHAADQTADLEAGAQAGPGAGLPRVGQSHSQGQGLQTKMKRGTTETDFQI